MKYVQIQGVVLVDEVCPVVELDKVTYNFDKFVNVSDLYSVRKFKEEMEVDGHAIDVVSLIVH